MTYTDIVKKLIGPVSPVGETNQDELRFENLKELCELVENLTQVLVDISDSNKHAHEYSIKRSVDYIDEILGIKKD